MPFPYDIFWGRETALPIGVNLSCGPVKSVCGPASPPGVETPV